MAITAGTALAIASLVASLGGTAVSISEAQKNRDWQEEMSNTSYQRAVADMEKSGINPILAYSQGGATVGSVGNASGASIPSLSLPNTARDSYYDKKLALDSHKLNIEQQEFDLKREKHELDMAINDYRKYQSARTGFKNV